VVTIVDVARLAGVGTTTVTKVLGGRRHVSAATRQRVLEAIAHLDYHPSHVGRSLRTGITRVIGVITAPPSTHPLTYAFFPSLLEGIGECAAEHGYDILWITTDSLRDERRSYEALFKSRRIDGLIDSWPWVGESRAGRVPASGHPFVLVGHPDDASVPHVDCANRDGGWQAGRAFVARGYDAIAYVGFREAPASRDRLAGLDRALAEHGRAIRPSHLALLERGQARLGHEQVGYTAMRQWIETGDVPRAVLAYTDRIAYGILRACREHRLDVPRDVAVIGFDDEPSSQHVQPPLASVAQPTCELGYEAAAMLIALLAGRAVDPPERVLPTQLVERESLGLSAGC
jgi:LacI family transcriptional regulator